MPRLLENNCTLSSTRVADVRPKPNALRPLFGRQCDGFPTERTLRVPNAVRFRKKLRVGMVGVQIKKPRDSEA